MRTPRPYTDGSGGHIRAHRVVSLLFTLAVAAVPVFGCSCVQLPTRLKTELDVARWYASGSDAIFEGTVERADFKWAPEKTPVGGLLPTDMDQMPLLLKITFNVSRTYKGKIERSATVITGVGHGDCGFDFEVGKRYLVYAYRDSSGELSTGICTATALLEESQTNLSYLQGEPIAENSKPSRHTPAEKLCGRVVSSGLKLSDSQILLFRIGSVSPIPYDEADPGDGGAFCFTDEEPGSYYLGFMSGAEGSPTSFVFYPGVSQRSEASEIDLKGGEVHPELTFNVPPQNAFSVRGNIATADGEPLPPECKVLLLRADRLSSTASYDQGARTDGSFDVSRVLPGKYWAFVTIDSDAAAHWLTRKAEVDVSSDVGDVSLELVRK